MAQRLEVPDSSEIDALESLVISEGYQLIFDRVMQEIERKRDRLEYSAANMIGPGGIEHSQGFLAACRMFMELPQTLADEIKQQIGEK